MDSLLLDTNIILDADSANILTIRAHQEVCKLANIKEGENIYPPIFDQTKRIDY